MKSLVLLLCLAQLWGCHSAPHSLGLVYRQPACDDPEIEKAAQVAVDYLNQHLLHGYKHTLNQIDKAKVWPRRPFGEVYELEIDTLETTCHARDPTPLANCPVRQVSQHAVEGDCDFHVLKQDTQLTVLHAKCHSTPDSAEDVRKVCSDCPLLIPLNDTRVVHAAQAALAAFNARHNGSYFKLVEISRAQFVPLPESTLVEFVVAATDCVAKEVIEPTSCNLLAEKQYGFCKTTLTEKLGGEEVAVTCTVFHTQPVVPQPQPDVAKTADPIPAVEQPAPALPSAGPPAPSVTLGHVTVAVPPRPPQNWAHYDLRNSFLGVASVESASGEAFHPETPPKVTHPGAVGPGGPLVRPCPGKVRHFKL